VPKELIRLVKNDNSLDKIQVQKAATPVDGRHATLENLALRMETARPNAVVAERSPFETADDNAIHCAATIHLASALRGQKRIHEQSVKDAGGKHLASALRGKRRRHEQSVKDTGENNDVFPVPKNENLFSRWLAPMASAFLDAKSRKACRATCRDCCHRFEYAKELKQVLKELSALPEDKKTCISYLFGQCDGRSI
jgi:hypothetical protein